MNTHTLDVVRSMMPSSLGRTLPILVVWDDSRACVVVRGLVKEEELLFRQAHPQFQVSLLPAMDNDPGGMIVKLGTLPFTNACANCGNEVFEAESHERFKCKLHDTYVERLYGPSYTYTVCHCLVCGVRRVV